MTETISYKRVFLILFFAIAVSMTGVGIVVPLLPVYADSLGASGFMIGMIFGSFSLSRSFFLPYFGRKSDAVGRKPFITAGLFLYGVASIAFMFAKTVELLVIVRFLQGIASAMIMPVTQAYVGEIAPKGREGFTMGLFNLSMNISLSLGPILGGVVKDRFGLRAAFGCMGLLAYSGFFMCLFLLPPKDKEPRAMRKHPEGYWGLLKHRFISGPVVFRLLFTVCVGMSWAFLPVLAAREFHISASRIGVLVMLSVLLTGLLQTPAGWLADRSDKRKMVAVGGLIIMISMVLFRFSEGFYGLLVANTVFGIGGGVATPPLMAICVIEGNRNQAMGQVMGLLTLGHSLGMLFGAIIGGVMMDLFHLRTAFDAGAVVVLAGTLFFMAATRDRKI